LNDADTIFYVFNNLRTQNYQLKFAPQNINEPDLTAYFIDKYMGTRTEISLTDSSFADFTITSDAGSYATDRFMLVFKRIPPVSYTDIRAVKQEHDVKVSWNVTNEVNIFNYVVERSTDGISFTPLGSAIARNTNNSAYNWLDQEPVTGINHYRVMSTSASGQIKYSDIVNVQFEAPATLITVYPNPLREDKVINVNLSNKIKGIYQITLTGIDGKMIMLSRIDHPGRSGVYPIGLGKLFTHGNYLLTIIAPDNKRTTFKIVY
jgi:hypothetical protein